MVRSNFTGAALHCRDSSQVGFASACERSDRRRFIRSEALHHEIAIGLDAPAGLRLPPEQGRENGVRGR